MNRLPSSPSSKGRITANWTPPPPANQASSLGVTKNPLPALRQDLGIAAPNWRPPERKTEKRKVTKRVIAIGSGGGTPMPTSDGGGDTPSGPTQVADANARLSLPADTPIGTIVHQVDNNTDYRLNAPSAEQGGAFVLGGTQDGIYVKLSDINPVNGRHAFTLLGVTLESAAYSGSPSTLWPLDSEEDFTGWILLDGSGLRLYYSLSDVATPDLATGWKNASDDSPASITVASVSVGELNAGVTFGGAGQSTANYTADKRGTYFARPFYNKIGTPTTIPEVDPDLSNAVWWDADVFIQHAGLSTFYSADVDSAFPWGDSSWTTGDPLNDPVPTVTRNDVASEANWEVVP